MKTHITYELITGKNNIPNDTYSSLVQLGEKYGKDIDGIDLGFGGMLLLTEHLFLIKHDRKDVGFLLGSQSAKRYFASEKSFCPIAAYLEPEYRNKSGKFKDVMKNSLRSLVDELEKKEFDRLNVIPDLMGSQGLITDIGLEHVLKPLYYILQERANKNKTDNESYQLVNMGSNEIYGAEFNPVYLFNRKAFNEKLAQVQNVAKAQMKKRLGEQNAS